MDTEIDIDVLSARFLSDDPPLTSQEQANLRHRISVNYWLDLRREKRANLRREFLKNKSPKEVLMFIMRTDDHAALQIQAAIALLPYMDDKKDAIEPPDQT